MAKYYLVSAKPKSASEHLKSNFKLYVFHDKKWSHSWKSVGEVVDLLQGGHKVVTGKIENKSMKEGSPIEVELRIANNNMDYKIGDMPDS